MVQEYGLLGNREDKGKIGILAALKEIGLWKIVGSILVFIGVLMNIQEGKTGITFGLGFILIFLGIVIFTSEKWKKEEKDISKRHSD